MIRKFILLSSLFFAGSLLHSESEMRMRSLEDRMTKMEKSNTDKHQYGPITPNAGPKVCDGMDMYLSIDFIYWSPRLDGLAYARSGNGNHVSKGTVHTVDWTFSPGFKAGFGWTFDHGGWDLFLQYTWLYSSVDDKTHASNLVPAFQESPDVRRGHADWDLHYQVGDLELGRNYYVNRFLKLRPFIGFKGTWQKQQFNAFFTSPASGSEMTELISRQQQRLWGVGMRAGLNTSWQFYKWWGLYGDFALSTLWLSYDIERLDYTQSILDPDDITTNIGTTLHNVKPVLEMGIGLRMETYFHNNRLHIRLQAGWESQVWINQTLFISLFEYYNRFDLNMHGLTAKLRLDF